jgi:hypothetical protein
MGLGSAAKFIPEIYLVSSVEQRTAVLQGILDTDGSLDVSNGVGIDYSSTSKRLTENVQSLVQSLGGTTTGVTKKKTSCLYKGEMVIGETYRIYIALPSDIRPFRLSRKLANLRSRTKYKPTRAISEIASIGSNECIRISVASMNKLDVTDNYIVTRGILDDIAVTPEAIASEPEQKPTKPSLGARQPEAEPAAKKVYGTYEEIVIDDELIARMMANMAAAGMTLDDI